jgi:hypothetical protein
MFAFQATVAVALAILLASFAVVVEGVDIMDAVGAEWKMGLRPRQAGTNLQPFSGALAGIAASPVSLGLLIRHLGLVKLIDADCAIGGPRQAIRG